ncbi:macrophage mannose receptor 1-like isoform X2 [Melanotaenia boesemani]|uniref:macrophage mannose receptor 1-like isoform X2 n=1 Tax=Melanotaenia boesemani TaxID=1250792 RepID=UPI001C050A53|nr:macrophage mannose receptor 1-like isoform X2 [Melanotaenia boesemani]
MEKFLLFVIAASALLGISSFAECAFYFVYDQKTWTEAQSYCEEKFNGLAPINNMEDVEILNNHGNLSKMLALDGNNLAWIGLRKDMSIFVWSDIEFYEDDNTMFRNWKSGEPNNFHGIESCVIMRDDGLWNDYPCDSTLNSVCYERGSTVNFVFIDQKMNFTEAQTFCREQYTDLVSITTSSDNEKIKQLLPPGSPAWIGLFRGYWELLNGSKSTFMYWSEWQPDTEKNCSAANFQNSGKWEYSNCDTRMSFICNTPVLKQVVRVKLARSSSLDLNDPAVLEDLLKKLKQKLKDQGVSEDFSLSWRKQPDGKIFYKEEEEAMKTTS